MNATVVVVTLLTFAFLAGTVEPCSDKFVKDMLVKVCGMGKRSFDGDLPVFGQNIGNPEDVEREFNRQIRIVYEDDEKKDHQYLDFKNSTDSGTVKMASTKQKTSVYLLKECCTRQCTVDDFQCDNK